MLSNTSAPVYSLVLATAAPSKGRRAKLNEDNNLKLLLHQHNCGVYRTAIYIKQIHFHMLP